MNIGRTFFPAGLPSALVTLVLLLPAAAAAQVGPAIAEPGLVPEPATWTMMITGFGLVGLGLRRSARKQPSEPARLSPPASPSGPPSIPGA